MKCDQDAARRSRRLAASAGICHSNASRGRYKRGRLRWMSGDIWRQAAGGEQNSMLQLSIIPRNDGRSTCVTADDYSTFMSSATGYHQSVQINEQKLPSRRPQTRFYYSVERLSPTSFSHIHPQYEQHCSSRVPRGEEAPGRSPCSPGQSVPLGSTNNHQ